MILPVLDQITQYFGENPKIYSRWGYPGHNGVDFGCSTGTPVVAAEDGKVFKIAREAGGYGNYVVLSHADNVYTYYAHLKSVGVKLGKNVKQGDEIALSDNTGFSTGPHLHFGVKAPGGKPAYKGYVDPMPYITGVFPEPEPEPTPVPPPTPGNGVPLSYTFKVMVDTLNVRSGPGTNYEQVGTLSMGALITSKKLHGNEIWIEFADGKFCAAIYDGDAYVKIVG